MFAPDLAGVDDVSGSNLAVAPDLRNVEGTGVVVSATPCVSAPIRWRMRVDALGGVCVGSGLLSGLHRSNITDAGAVSTCGFLSEAWGTPRGSRNGTPRGRPASVGAAEGVGGSSSSFLPSASHRATDGPVGSLVSVGLVGEAVRPFRGELLVSRSNTVDAKLRGGGLAWRSDGVLLAQRPRPDGSATSWVGNGAAYGAGDELELFYNPLAGEVRLFLNGHTVAGFPEFVLGGAVPARLAVRVTRSRVALVGEKVEHGKRAISRGCGAAEAFPTGLTMPVRPGTCEPDEAAAIQAWCTDILDDQASRDLRTAAELRGEAARSLARAQQRRWPQECYPRVYHPGLGSKFVGFPPHAKSHDQAALLANQELESRVAANRNRRLAAAAISVAAHRAFSLADS